MKNQTIEKVEIQATPAQIDLLEFLEPLEVPDIYKGLKLVYEEATHMGPEALEPPVKVGSHHLFELLDLIGRLKPGFNPLEE